MKIRGYTLLELMVVLVLLGMVMGIATPRLIKMYEAVSFSLKKADLLFQLEKLPYMAYQRGKGFSLTDTINVENKAPLELPDGWGMSQVSGPIKYNFLGYCTGGEIRIFTEKHEIYVRLSAPFCKAEIL